MKNLAIRLLINAAALWVAARFVDGVELVGGIGDILIVALVFGAVNALIKPIVKFFSVPFIVLSLGLFTLVINALMLLLAARLTTQLSVSGFMPALIGSIVISIVSFVLSTFLRDDDGDED